MHEDEFGYAYQYFNEEIVPHLISQGFTAGATQVPGELPVLEARVSIAHGDVTLSRHQSWAEMPNGTVSSTRLVSLHLQDFADDHPYNVVLGKMSTKEFRYAALAGIASKGRQDIELEGELPTVSYPTLSSNFAGQLQSGLVDFIGGASPKATHEFATRTAEVLLLVEYAAERGLTLKNLETINARSDNVTSLNFYRDDEKEHCLRLKIQPSAGRWAVNEALLPGAHAAGESRHYRSAKVSVKQSFTETIDRTLAILGNGRTRQEATIYYLLGIAEDLKAEGLAVSTQLRDEVDSEATSKLLEISVGKVEGNAQVSARHIFTIRENGHALKQVLPSARFINLPTEHRDNLAMAQFDLQSPAEALGMLQKLRKARALAPTGVCAYPERDSTESNFAYLSNARRLMTPFQGQGPVEKTPSWTTTLAQMMQALEAARWYGFGREKNWNTQPGTISFRKNFVDYSSDSEPYQGHLDQVFQLRHAGNNDLTAGSTYTVAGHQQFTLTGKQEFHDQVYIPLAGMPLDEAVYKGCAEAMTRDPEMLAAARTGFVAEQIGECWLESVDPQRGVAHVGISSVWSDKKLKLVEVSLDGWTATGLSAPKETISAIAGIGLGGEADEFFNKPGMLEVYAPAIEKHILASATRYLQALEPLAASVKLSALGISKDGKSAVASVPDETGAAADLTFNIKKAGGQIVLSRADTPAARRPFRDITHTRTLELLLAPVVGQLLEQECANRQPAAKTKAPTKSTKPTDIER